MSSIFSSNMTDLPLNPPPAPRLGTIGLPDFGSPVLTFVSTAQPNYQLCSLILSLTVLQEAYQDGLHNLYPLEGLSPVRCLPPSCS